MKQYKITKIIFAESITSALKNELKAEIVDIELNEPITQSNKIGFK